MPLDGIFIHYLVDELSSKLTNGKINKISEPNNLDIIIQVRAKDINNKIISYDLLVSSALDMPRCFITKKKYASVDVPKNFCMVLRKYIERGTILSISQLDNDRAIIFDILSTNELGDAKRFKLIVELMGRNSNVILINEQNIIIDAMRKLPPSEDVTRIILPHATYKYPSSNNNVNPFLIKDANESLPLQGVAKQVLNYLADNKESIFEYLSRNNLFAIYNLGNKFDFYAHILYDKSMIEKEFNTPSELLDYYYNNYKVIFTDKAKDLKRSVKAKITHYETKYANLLDDLEKAKENIIYNKYGILLQASLYKVTKGASYVIVSDFMDDNKDVRIELNPLLDASRNLAKIFQKGKKAKNALVMIQKQLDITKDEIEYLTTIYNQIDFANSIDLDEIKEELTKNKYLKEQKRVKPKNKKVNLNKYKIGNLDVIVGKNNIQNDYITNHLARSFDWWFHVKDAPGSHVLLIVPSYDYKLSEQEIRYCSNLAATFSKCATSSSVAVDYMQARYIKKIPGKKGCNVTYTNQKTIYIDPNPVQ